MIFIILGIPFRIYTKFTEYNSDIFGLQKYTNFPTWQNIFSQSKEKVYFCSWN